MNEYTHTFENVTVDIASLMVSDHTNSCQAGIVVVNDVSDYYICAALYNNLRAESGPSFFVDLNSNEPLRAAMAACVRKLSNMHYNMLSGNDWLFGGPEIEIKQLAIVDDLLRELRLRAYELIKF